MSVLGTRQRDDLPQFQPPGIFDVLETKHSSADRRVSRAKLHSSDLAVAIAMLKEVTRGPMVAHLEAAVVFNP